MRIRPSTLFAFVVAGWIGSASAGPAPFLSLEGLALYATGSDSIAAKWRGLRERLQRDLEQVRSCVADCPETTEKFRAAVALKTSFHGRELLSRVNRFVNKKIVPSSDERLYGVDDYWASPLETFRGSGDCEDYVFAKYAVLLAIGIPAIEMRPVIVDRYGLEHMILAVRSENDWLILDTLTQTLNNDAADVLGVLHYRPKFVLEPSGIVLEYVAHGPLTPK